jgi:octaprenyl-diphosphate synthase
MNPIQTKITLHKLKNFVKEDLSQMDLVIARLTHGKEQLIFKLSNHLIASGGKRLRPILTIICAKLFGYAGNKHIDFAAAVEFIHTATLLHDDVVDESSLRRGKPTANHQWGNKASILVGDFLLSQAFKLMVAQNSLEALDILSSASAVIAEGEVMQLAATNNLTITEIQYIEIIKAKTAELFAAACQIGAVVANGSEPENQALRHFGMSLGIAFQIIDDALDYSANIMDLGKDIGNDFKEGKVTLPVLIAYRRSNELEKAFWLRTMKLLDQKPEDLEQAIDLIKKHDAFNYCLDQAKSYINQASAALSGFPPSEAKLILSGILDFAIERSY